MPKWNTKMQNNLHLLHLFNKMREKKKRKKQAYGLKILTRQF